MKLRVPNRILSGKDVYIARVFECKEFVHFPKDERFKLKVNTRHCVFVGCGLNEFICRLIDPVNAKLIKNCDAAFVEVLRKQIT